MDPTFAISIDQSPRIAALLADAAPTPEELLAEAEDPVEEVERPELCERLGVTPERLAALIDRLPPIEGDILDFLGRGVYQHEIAQVIPRADGGRMSQAAISYRLQRARERMRWMLGPGSWFTVDDVRRELGPVLDEWPGVRVAARTVAATPASEALAVLWETTCLTEVDRLTGWRADRVKRIVRGLLPEISGEHPHLERYEAGFRELFDRRLQVLWEQPRWIPGRRHRQNP